MAAMTGHDDTNDANAPDFAKRDMEHSEAPIDQLGQHAHDDEEQNPALPDGGPTDGEHGTDNDPSLQDD